MLNILELKSVATFLLIFQGKYSLLALFIFSAGQEGQKIFKAVLPMDHETVKGKVSEPALTKLITLIPLLPDQYWAITINTIKNTVLQNHLWFPLGGVCSCRY